MRHNHKIPTRITQTLYVEYVAHADPPIRLSTIDMSDSWPVLGTVEVTVPLPDDLADPVVAQVEGLQRKRAKAQAAHNEWMADIDERIKRLQCIEYQPEESA